MATKKITKTSVRTAAALAVSDTKYTTPVYCYGASALQFLLSGTPTAAGVGINSMTDLADQPVNLVQFSDLVGSGFNSNVMPMTVKSTINAQDTNGNSSAASVLAQVEGGGVIPYKWARLKLQNEDASKTVELLAVTAYVTAEA